MTIIQFVFSVLASFIGSILVVILTAIINANDRPVGGDH